MTCNEGSGVRVSEPVVSQRANQKNDARKEPYPMQLVQRYAHYVAGKPGCWQYREESLRFHKSKEDDPANPDDQREKHEESEEGHVSCSIAAGSSIPTWMRNATVVPLVVSMQIYRSSMSVVLLSALLSNARAQQPPPAMGPPIPDPGPHRVEVRFALGKASVKCKKFSMVAKEDGHLLFKGSFKSGFDIPRQAENLPRRDALDLEFRCNGHRWRFSKVGERAFLHGWWWVGTDYPPFHELMRSTDLKDAIWMQYLMIAPVEESGFYVYKACPAKFKDQKPGPCYDD